MKESFDKEKGYFNMITIKNKNDLKCADKYGDCLSCGISENIYKITFSKDDNQQQTSIRLCSSCIDILERKILEIHKNEL